MTNFFSLSDLSLSQSPNALLQQWLTYMQQQYPGYTPSAGNLEYIMAVIFATWAADVANQASQGSTELFAQFGQQLVGVQPNFGSSSTATLNVAAIDTAGYTLPAGTQFLFDSVFGFQTSQVYVIPEGSQSITVTVASVTIGSDTNGAGSGSGVLLNEQIFWVQAVNLVSAAGGGVDPETSDSYVNRLATELQLMAPRPITATDYGTFALNFQPEAGTTQQEVGRGTAIDGYNPNDGTSNNERMVCVCVTDSSGNALSAATMTAIAAWFQTLREANFIVNVVAPTYTPVYVRCSVQRNTAFDASTVQENIQTALVSLISPNTWGQPVGSTTGWINQPFVYESVIESTIQNAGGVTNIVNGTLGVGLNPNPNGTTDLLLNGPFPLPTTDNGVTIPLSAITVVN